MKNMKAQKKVHILRVYNTNKWPVILAITVLAFNTCFPVPLPSSAPPIDWLHPQETIAVKQKRKFSICTKPPGGVLHIYFHTLPRHITCGVFSAYLIVCASLGEPLQCLAAGFAIFCLSSLGSLLQIIAHCRESERLKKFSSRYGYVFHYSYMLFVVTMTAVIGAACLVHVYVYSGITEWIYIAHDGTNLSFFVYECFSILSL